ncbi:MULTISPECIES: EcsC family protein [Pandoraea]|uniref:Peptidase n=2 Tax=Pandoraea TaxID=93217 RepID=A0A5E4XMM4_9BURK|nr:MULTISPECIES: EcsC family protein [Pandoraea]VVE14502.1 hypothetical protein PCE31107_02817 [Pandoraea cepalis]VVE37378.1 hypothetical protein PTE31013_04001 [Pandoraea terrigena]
MQFSDEDLAELLLARNLLENPGFAARIASAVGKPIDMAFGRLPESWQLIVADASKAAMFKAADAAVFTMKDVPGQAASNRWHLAGVTTTGAVGGFFGLAGLPLELPVSTTIMLRSIADVARSYGEVVSEYETKLACLTVFALGGTSKSDDAAESGYFAIRAGLARAVQEAIKYMAAGAGRKSTPALIQLIERIAERFAISVSEKTMAQLIPAIGALGGAAINAGFMSHFQDMAKGHFIVRKLERRYGPRAVRSVYESLADRVKASP